MTPRTRIRSRVPRIPTPSRVPRRRGLADAFVATALAAALAVAGPGAVPAARAGTPPDPGPGFRAGLRLASSSIPLDQRPLPSMAGDGGGAVPYAGWAFSRVFTLELDVFGADHDVAIAGARGTVAAIDLVGVYHWRPGRRARPYVKGGLGAVAASIENGPQTTTASGGALPLGAGLDVALSRHVTLGVDLTHRVVSWDDLRLEGGAPSFALRRDGSQTSFSLGVGLRF